MSEKSEPKKDPKKHTPEIPEPKEGTYLPNLSDTVSSMECTGLIPATPEDSAQMNSYKELSSLSLPHEAQKEMQD
jgi:hypothetical protein